MTLNLIKYLGNGKFQHAGAHLDILIHRKKNGKIDRIKTKGFYLNIFDDITRAVTNHNFTMEVGDTMLLYTDGLTESRNSKGELLDIEGTISLFNNGIDQEVEKIKNYLVTECLDWCKGNQEDDISLLVIRRMK